MNIMGAAKAANVSNRSWKNVAITVGLTAGAAALTWLGQNLSDMDFGKNGAFIVPVVTALIVYAKQWITETLNKPKPEPEDDLPPNIIGDKK